MRRSRTCLAIGTAIAVAGLSVQLAAPTSHPESSRVASAARPVLQRFSPVYMTSGVAFTQAQAVTLAQNFDVLAASKDLFTPYVAAMKAANPNLRLLVYVNATFSLANAYPLGLYARDAGGQLIHSTGWPNTFLMDGSNPAWATAVGQLCASRRVSSGDDGCFLDVMGPAPLNPAYCSSLAIDPATHAIWGLADWLAATGRIAAQVRVANPGAPVAANGLVSGNQYFAVPGTAPLLGSVDAGMAESWLRPAAAPITSYRTQPIWLKDVDMMVGAEARGYGVVVTVKTWVAASPSQLASWHEYALATFLLGAGGRSAFSFLATSGNASITADYAWDHVAIGAPSGPYALVAGVYQRSFANGLVLANPGRTAVTVPLGGTYFTLGRTAVTVVTLAADTGKVLTLT